MHARPWDRQPGEDARWYARFTAYRLLGRGRTLEAVWRQEAKDHQKTGKYPPKHWYAVAAEWNWKERAAAWDIYQAEQDAQYQMERRRAIITKALEKLEKRLDDLDGKPLTWRTFADVMSTLFGEQRIEYDQQPAQQLNVTLSMRQTIEQIAKARGIDADELERRTLERLRELGVVS